VLLFNYSQDGMPRIGYEHAGACYDLEASWQGTGHAEAGIDAALGEGSISLLIEKGLLAHPGLVEVATRSCTAVLDRQAISFRPPVDRPRTIVGVGRNYGAHADEGGLERQAKPRLFDKFASSVIGHGDKIPRPVGVRKLDWEAEVGVVIARPARSVSREKALDHVAGYLPLNDITAREFQFDVSPGQTSFAKSMDGFCPIGPTLLVASDEVDPADFAVRAFVNGEKMQDGHTSDLIFDIAYLISYTSQYVTLMPGDIIATGTPAGVGHFRKPPVYLQPGDTVAVEIEGIGRLENIVTERA